MGQKTHPKVFRMRVIESWDSKWYAGRDYSELLPAALKIKGFQAVGGKSAAGQALLKKARSFYKKK